MNYTFIEDISIPFFKRYRATDPETNKEVILDEVIISNEWNYNIIYFSFCKEFTLNDLPGIVHILDFPKTLMGFTPNANDLKTYIIHEKAANGNLFRIIPDYLENHQYPGINPTVRSKIIFGVAATMKYAHERKVPHLMLELNNIYLDEKYEPRIANFTNINKLVSQYSLGLYTTVLDSSKAQLVPYMVEHEEEDDDYLNDLIFTDIYGFGCFLCQMFSNEFTQYMNQEFRKFHVPKPTIPESAPPHYRDLIHRCFTNQIHSFDEIVEILKNDQYAISEFGQQTDLNELHRYQNFIDKEPVPLSSTENIACKILFDPPESVQNGINQSNSMNTDNEEFQPIPNKTQLLSCILNDQQKKIKEQQEEIKQLKDQIAQLTNNNNNTHVANDNITILTSEEVRNLRNIEEVGNGALGHVYKVGKEEIYATKVLSGTENLTVEHFRRLLNEYEILNLLSHPNILKTFGFCFGDETTPPTMLIEFCPKNLEKEIRDGSMDNIKIAFSIYQIAEGFRFLHFNRIIHRDIKPKNILIAEDGTIKICDFGISKLMTTEEQTMTLGIGTQKFMAPELINENPNYTEKIDIYSFGVLVYFMLNNGQMPTITVPQIAAGIKANIPENVNDFAKNLINNCWNLDPETRPSFSDICNMLQQENYKIVDLSEEEELEVNILIQRHKNKIPRY